MRKVFLLTGFNNWGKTTLIYDLFGKRRFLKHIPHVYSGKNFCVIPQSNDDLGEPGYIDAYKDRVNKALSNWGTPGYIFSAFCPTKEPTNDSSRIISSIYSGDNVYIIPIVYKWCGHAKLILPKIEDYYKMHKNVQVHPLSSKMTGTPKLKELQKVIAPLL
ncbi:hypothetical protein CWC05_01880 [Pseudoalteromonas ruthenica]|uniref:G domain-containing protein n=1 Tax=Pseudoalteromonas ruthenica TaxID=151081 RepID=A0A5S3Z7I0_9GAMM|nr:hypothetical protein [Pseudoalteromonas ruthenica]TMP88212.1 hypothetical protein CWC05_01880 [Pseudoalteromonas ruthenica]